MDTSISSGKSLNEIADNYWEAAKRNDPVAATSLGDRRFDDKLADISVEHRTIIIEEYRTFLNQTESIDELGLSPSDRLTRSALIVELSSQIEYLEGGLDDWIVDPLRGPLVNFLNMESLQPVRTPMEAAMMTKRWQAMAPYIVQHMKNLKSGLAENKVSVVICVKKVADELSDLFSKPVSEWALLLPLRSPHDDWTEVERVNFRAGLTSAVRDAISPAFTEYLNFLNSEILPRARPADRPGIMHIPGGSEVYERLIRFHTSLDLSPEELHQTGLNEVSKINQEMEILGERVFGIRKRTEVLQRLRTDKSLYFSSRDDVETKAKESLARAKAAIPRWFGRLPVADCEVVVMGEHEEKHSTIAYYLQGSPDGSRAGRYYVNTYAPETRPLYEAEALAYHESIPGHHLQISIAQELKGIPDFRKYSGVTAFVEGWGLYTERLADKMELYSSDLDRVGMLSYDSWRACRLVVDTGMHAKGWTRDEAINFMWENSALAMNNITNEVDRYITWPGQALAYKTGQLHILRMRQKAKEALGDRFDIRRFHDVVLSNGALPLAAVEEVVDNYMKEQKP